MSAPGTHEEALVKTRIAVIMPAKNEEETIGAALRSLLDQTHKLDQIIVVLGDCKDDTPRVASEYASKHREIKIVHKVESRYRGTFFKGFRVAEAINEGLRTMDKGIDYVMISGADSTYSPAYVEAGVKILEKNPSVAIVGFRSSRSILGSGAIYRYSFLKEANNGFFIECGAEDTYLWLKARSFGYSVKPLIEEEMRFMRVQGQGGLTDTMRYALSKGYTCYVLGYVFPYVLGRAFLMARNPLLASILLISYVYALSTRVKKLDIASFTSQYQKKRIKQVLSQLMKGKIFLKEDI